MYQLAKLVLAGESIALDSELSDFLKEYEVSFMPTPDGGALVYIADNFRPYGVYYCETDDRSNITAVYDENGILRYEATHETFQNPTGWAMYMSAYRFVLGIL